MNKIYNMDDISAILQEYDNQVVVHEIMTLLSGGDINGRNLANQTALIIASKNGYTNLVQALLMYGADVNIQDNNGKTATIEALTTLVGRKEIVKILIEARADVNIQDSDGQTALIIASADGHMNSVLGLIEAGADVNIEDNNCKTALMYATHESVKELLMRDE